MPIVSSSYSSTPQANGDLSVVIKLYDQDAREYVQTFFAPADYNVAARVTTMIAEMNEQLAEAEFEQIVGL